MKKSFTILLILLICVRGAGQQVIFSEDFESFTGYNINGWPQQHNQFAIPWETGLTYLIGTTCFDPPGNTTRIAGVTDTYHGQQSTCMFTHDDSNVLLSTPDIDLSNVSGAYLKYDSYFQKTIMNGEEESATIELTTDSGQTWTVLQDVPANPPQGFATYYIDLSAYDNTQNVRIGFRYQDKGEHMTGWMIDNIEVLIPSSRDLKLVSAGKPEKLLSYASLGSLVYYPVTVFNAGLDTISSFTISYLGASGTVHSHVVSVQVDPFATYSFVHPVPDTVSGIGDMPVTFRVDAAGDVNPANDSAHSILRGCWFMPHKQLVIEEGTGTFDVWGPRGQVYMSQAAQNDNNICQISVHGNAGDPMAVPDYSETLFYIHWNYIPYFLFDRRQNISPDKFFSEIAAQQSYFGFADINLEGGLNNDQLEVQAHVTPALDMSGDFRLALIVTEDDVTGTSPAYDQRNKYAGGAYGPMGGYENKPDPVPAADMHYNFVARGTYPDSHAEGTAGILPPTLEHNIQYDQTLTATIDPSWDKSKLKAHVLLVRHDDSTVLNSSTLPFYLAVKGADPGTVNAGLYPNPSADQAFLYFTLDRPETISWSVTDISGRQLLQGNGELYPAGRSEISLPIRQLSSGIYLVQLVSPHGKKTIKMQILR